MNFLLCYCQRVLRASYQPPVRDVTCMADGLKKTQVRKRSWWSPHQVSSYCQPPSPLLHFPTNSYLFVKGCGRLPTLQEERDTHSRTHTHTTALTLSPQALAGEGDTRRIVTGLYSDRERDTPIRPLEYSYLFFTFCRGALSRPPTLTSVVHY